MQTMVMSVIQRELPYCNDPTQIFQKLCDDRPATLLLESADIDSKDNLKSLMIIDAALRITATKTEVLLEALTENGVRILEALEAYLQVEFSVNKAINDLKFQVLRVKIPILDREQDEDSRLKSVSAFSILRMLMHFLKTQLKHDQTEYLKELFLGGLFSYDLIEHFEEIWPKDVHDQREGVCPDFCLYLAETLLELNHQTQTAHLFGLISDAAKNQSFLTEKEKQLQDYIDALAEPILQLKPVTLVENTLTVSQSDQHYSETVMRLQEHILAGDIFQVVPSRFFSLQCPSPLQAYQTLKQSNPSPYMFYMQDQDFSLFGASPESALKFDANTRQVEIYPIAGTAPRGRKDNGDIDYDLDSRLELDLRNNQKELSEHTMLVDLARNDLARVCEPGSRHVADLLKVDRYSMVMHLVSRVVGKLREDLDALHAYGACINMGTLTGAPKVRAMQLIAKEEGCKRGSYGGSVGYLNGLGDLDTCIVIRSAIVKNGIANIQAGAGVVLDSVPQKEADESRQKAQAVINAIVKAHNTKELHHD